MYSELIFAQREAGKDKCYSDFQEPARLLNANNLFDQILHVRGLAHIPALQEKSESN